MNRKFYISLSLFIALAVPVQSQIVIDSLSYEITVYGDVVLKWTSPQGIIISKYAVYRGTSFGNMQMLAEIYSSTARQYVDHSSNVVPGTRYIYGLEAYAQGDVGWKDIHVLVTPPPSGLKFTSIPPTTAHIGSDYWYFPRVETSRPEDIEYAFGGKKPDGMELNSISGGIITTLYWRPLKAGQYNVTLVATHKVTKSIGVQEFSILVSTKPGTVKGVVRSVNNQPLPQTIVRVFQVADAMSYETTTDSLGRFLLNNVQAGEIYAYAKPRSDNFVPQWYSLGQTLKDVTPRTLVEGDTLTYDFYLLTAPGKPTLVAGKILDTNNQPVAGVSVSFVKKSRFIHIGDTSVISNPGFVEQFRVDTMVYSDATGQYAAFLEVGKSYYSIVSKNGYLTSFNANHPSATPTNALEARSFRVQDGLTDVNYTLTSSAKTENRIVGEVLSAENSVNKQAIVVLIDPELKRGAGGGHTYRQYRSTLSDESGYYQFDNLLSTKTYSVLAIPVDRGLAPLYYKAEKGTTVSAESDGITPNGTVQNIDFPLQQTRATGVGTIYGQVEVQTQNGRFPAVGTLLFAERVSSGEVIGYAITDSTGGYSISGLPPGDYVVHADNPSYGSIQPVDIIRLDYTSFNIFSALKRKDLLYVMVSTEPVVTPGEVTLYQNYPNPFNPETAIQFYLPEAEYITLKVVNALGQELEVLLQGKHEPGNHSVKFDGSRLSSGLYYYQLKTTTRTLSKKMVLLK